jgi:hypothetical protein
MISDRPPARRAEAAYVEIVERVPFDQLGTAVERGIVMPTEVRINGAPLLCPKDDPVEIHTIRIGEDAVKVTLTLWARMIKVGHEHVEGEG